MSKFLYEEAKTKILDLIIKNEVAPNTRIWNERILSQRLGYSRSTIKRAINSLVSDNVLEKRPGSGTYLKGAKLNNSLAIGDSSPNSFTQITRINQKTVSNQVESFKMVYQDPTKENLFAPQTEFYELIRTRKANNKIVALQKSYFPFRQFSDAHRYDFGKLSLYDYMESKKLKPHHFKTTIKAEFDNDIASRMNLVKEKYLLLFEYLGYTREDELVEYTLSWYDPNVVNFEMKIRY
ncbi:GntR family transcriptional regulator [Lactobacillus sp. ESL0684]|uniref:GntR family transcriptional regulator n=1 Tax=unclassified Lactobacillus TaxID=2620435 RepID=UPI0023F6BF89|nr:MULTISPECIES: GntR family transcriptional regulator [unclassified Lactobacillus]WEV40379.1 GntR family transcriptional regulator [Lactobacillus sp. ESL0681]WEV43173.1 GntR family transcriptional regulator [Lactobacillus sp. ESL0684]